MILRILLVTGMLLAGIPAAQTVTIAPHGSATGASVTASSTAAATDGIADVSVTQIDVVVPAVEVSGEIVESPELAEAQAAEDVIVTDQVVAGDRVESAVVETGPFQTLGVTWPEGAEVGDLGVEVRARVGDQWSAWIPLAGSDEAPDAGTADSANEVRGGTDSMWVGDADAVQLSFTATAEGGPEDLSLALVGTDALPAPAAAGSDATPAVGAASSTGTTFIRTAAHGVRSPVRAQATALPTATVPPPDIITRAEWGARPEACTPDVAARLVGAVVHHTAGSNGYSTVEQAMQQIRNDQAYHIDGRGWCDIGYNFIVDKWGNIYEGRANSLTQPVIGVHAGGFNTGTVGVSMLGNYTDIVPPVATQNAVAQIIGVRFSAYGLNPDSSMEYYTGAGENSKYANQTVVLPRVFGHRDVAYTACPGNAGYPTLGAIRTRATRVAYSLSLVQALYHDMLQRSVDPTGQQTWTTQLIAGVSTASLADTLARSQEYVQRRVSEGYSQILARSPDPTGFATWITEITSGRLRVEDLRGQLIASDEYYARAGGTDQAYIAALYRDILHRAATPSEIAWWVDTIRVRGRGAAPHGVWRSLESAQLRVHETYDIYLDRAADPAGLSTWGPYWQARGEDALRAQIVGSPEYLARSATLFP